MLALDKTVLDVGRQLQQGSQGRGIFPEPELAAGNQRAGFKVVDKPKIDHPLKNLTGDAS